MDTPGTNETIKNFFAKNWISFIVIFVLGVVVFLGVERFQQMNSHAEQTRTLLGTYSESLAAREVEIQELSASFNRQQQEMEALRVQYDQELERLRQEFRQDLESINSRRTVRRQELIAKPSEISSEFSRVFGMRSSVQ